MTPKGTTRREKYQLKHFERVIVCIHIGKSSLVKYSIEWPHKRRRNGEGGRVGQR